MLFSFLLASAAYVGSCLLPTPAGDVVLGDARATITRGQVSTVRCTGEQDPPGVRIELDWTNTGLLCACGNTLTADWLEVIEADGSARMTCRSRRE